MLLIATCKNTKNSIFLKLKNPITMHITHVIGFLFLLKIREIFIFNIMFTAFIKILPVGELPQHTPRGIISTKDLIGDFDTFVQKNHTNEWGMASVLMMRSLAGISGGEAQDKCQYQYRINATHNHEISFDNIGSSKSHNNMQPYISAYIWKRVQ